MFINIELKDDRLQLTFDKVIEVVEKYNMIEQIAFSSFKHGYYDIICHYCHEKNYQIEFGFLYHDKSKKEKFIPYRFDILCCNYPDKAKTFRDHYYANSSL